MKDKSKESGAESRREGLTHPSEMTALEIGIRRAGEVLWSWVMGLVVSWLMSKLWPVPQTDNSHTTHTP